MPPVKNRLTRSVRCHIRRQKGEIRRTAHTLEEHDRRIADLYARFGVVVR